MTSPRAYGPEWQKRGAGGLIPAGGDHGEAGTARLGLARPGWAWLGRARQARCGAASHGRLRLGRAGQGSVFRWDARTIASHLTATLNCTLLLYSRFATFEPARHPPGGFFVLRPAMSSDAAAPAAISNFELNNKSSTARRSQEVGESRTSRGRSEGYARDRPVGRYDGRRESTRLPPNGIARPAPSENVRTAVVAVPDPFGDGSERVLVTVNRRVDVLENERSHQRVSEAAYRTGRLLQAVFERAGGVGSSNWMGTSKQDPMIAQEMRVLRSLIAAEEIEKLLRRVRGYLGRIDARLLQRILGERWTYAECADIIGQNGERGARYVAARFRHALEELAEAWTAKGASAAHFEDKYAAAAVRAATRPEEA